MKVALIAFVCSLILTLICGLFAIPLLRKLKFGQNILGYVKEHDYKRGTPTMGGLFFVLSAVIVFSFASGGKKSLSLVSVAVGLGYMAVGFLDDFVKIKMKRNEGLSPWQKTVFELVIAIVISVYAYNRKMTRAYLPFFGGVVDFGVAFIPISVLVFIATTNCVNLTDGLDGLAGGVSYLYFLSFAALIKLETIKYSAFYVSVGEYENLALLSVTLAGAIIGFLTFNTFKASVFMGDTGSLAIGGFIASMSIFGGNMLFIPFFGITFVASGISVILQVLHFKRTGRRIFLMAPLHHHFQHKGYSESKIAFCYKLATLLVSLISLAFYM